MSEFSTLMHSGFSPVGFAMGASVVRLGDQLSARRLFYKPKYGISGSSHISKLMPFPQNASVRLPAGYQGGYKQIYPCEHVADGHVPGVNYEDETFEETVVEAYNSAKTRLREEASRLRAHGVVGIRVEITSAGPAAAIAPSMELRMLGTAVRSPEAPELDQPFLANLSAQAMAKLLRSGWVPLDTAIGVGIVRSYFGCAGSVNDPYMRLEFTQRSEAMQRCRELAAQRLTSHATSKDEQVIDAEVIGPFGPHYAKDTLFEFSLVGTVILRFASGAVELPNVAVDLGLQ